MAAGTRLLVSSNLKKVGAVGGAEPGPMGRRLLTEVARPKPAMGQQAAGRLCPAAAAPPLSTRISPKPAPVPRPTVARLRAARAADIGRPPPPAGAVETRPIAPSSASHRNTRLF